MNDNVLTVEDVAAMKSRADACPAPPWWPRYGSEPGYIYASESKTVLAKVLNEMNDGDPRPVTLFVIASRSDLPALCASHERLRAMVSELSERVAKQSDLLSKRAERTP